MTDRIFNIESGIELLQTPLFGNKYLVVFVGVGVKVSDIFDDKIGLMVNSVSLPTSQYTPSQYYIGGVSINKITSFEHGQLDMTMYNTGREYTMIKKWGESQYNQKTKAYSFPNDTLVDITVSEYNRAGQEVIHHVFSGCNLLSYGGISLAYEEASAVEVFSVSMDYRMYEVK